MPRESDDTFGWYFSPFFWKFDDALYIYSAKAVCIAWSDIPTEAIKKSKQFLKCTPTLKDITFSCCMEATEGDWPFLVAKH